jgi:hypothetical protein
VHQGTPKCLALFYGHADTAEGAGQHAVGAQAEVGGPCVSLVEVLVSFVGCKDLGPPVLSDLRRRTGMRRPKLIVAQKWTCDCGIVGWVLSMYACLSDGCVRKLTWLSRRKWNMLVIDLFSF